MSVFVQFLAIDSSHLCDTEIDQPSTPPLSSRILIHPVPFHILLWFTFNSTDYLEFNNIKIDFNFYILYNKKQKHGQGFLASRSDMMLLILPMLFSVFHLFFKKNFRVLSYVTALVLLSFH